MNVVFGLALLASVGSAQVRFTIRDQPLFGLYTRYSGDLPVTVTLVDAAGNLSNAVASIKQQWLVGLF